MFKIQDYLIISSEILKCGWTLTTSQYTTKNSYWKYKSYIINKLVICVIYTHTHTYVYSKHSPLLQDLMVGDEASQLRSMLEVNYPMDNGIVRNWEDMTHIYDHTFGKERLGVDTSSTRILLTEPPMNPTKNREKMVEVRMIASWMLRLVTSRLSRLCPLSWICSWVYWWRWKWLRHGCWGLWPAGCHDCVR